ncbi:MAG TPA: hypothetical protein VHC43_15680 [Mycobacteriales bacterium]|nr:hypothetical protein [Mycobacteriales bacterium]
MVTLDQVAKACLTLPGVEEVDRRGQRTWKLGEKTFAWERTFSKADIRRYGDAPIPSDPIVAVRVADEAEKAAVLAQGRSGFFTIPHFDGFSAVLIELGRAKAAEVRESLIDGWLVYADEAAARKVLGQRKP